ncbi:MAG TPA: sensor histidine kinase [Candidatus Limnocylindrales bacterium]|nr:sensor histidine kinase [Candidatus Limnocylindrales bacterium]
MALKLEAGWRPLGRLLGDYRFWLVQALAFGIATLHSILEAKHTLANAPDLYLLPVSTYLVPVIYAGLKFGLAGAVPTALWCSLLTVPELTLYHQGLQRVGVAAQLVIILALGAVVAYRVDTERRAKLAAEAANRELAGARESLAEYLGMALRAQEEERGRLARDLHDETIQDLLVVRAALEDQVRSHDGHYDPAVTETLEKTIDGIRRVCRALRPSLLDDLGLVPAVEWLLSDLAGRSRIHAGLQVDGECVRLDAESELAIFRITQEALRNVEKHAQAHEVKVSVAYRSNEVRLEVFDDGRGFEPTQRPEGSLGLTGMRERARLIGADLHVSSRPGSTRVVLTRRRRSEPADAMTDGAGLPMPAMATRAGG